MKRYVAIICDNVLIEFLSAHISGDDMWDLGLLYSYTFKYLVIVIILSVGFRWVVAHRDTMAWNRSYGFSISEVCFFGIIFDFHEEKAAGRTKWENKLTKLPQMLTK